MRHVAPIAFADLKPADISGRAEPHFDRLAPSDLLVDEAYQRGLSKKSEKLIRAIIEGWDWLRFKPPVVALTDEGFEVVDGQHTAIAAACHPDIVSIPIVVVDGTDLPRRARAFVSHAVDRLQATPAQVWHAAVAGGDEDAVAVRDVLAAAGVTMLRRNPDGNRYGPRETRALGAVRGLVERRGAERAREVLEALAQADLAPISNDQIRAAEALLCDDAYADNFDASRVTAAFRALTPAIMAEVRELAAARRLPMWRALAALVFRRAPRRTRSRASGAAPAPAHAPDPEPEPAPPADRTPLPVAERLGNRVKRPPGARTFDGLGRVIHPTPALAALVGPGPLLRSDALEALAKYVKTRDLYDASDRKVIVADEKLRAATGRERLSVADLNAILDRQHRVAA